MAHRKNADRDIQEHRSSLRNTRELNYDCYSYKNVKICSFNLLHNVRKNTTVCTRYANNYLRLLSVEYSYYHRTAVAA